MFFNQSENLVKVTNYISLIYFNYTIQKFLIYYEFHRILNGITIKKKQFYKKDIEYL